jgi:class 3 adenylate cyclase
MDAWLETSDGGRVELRGTCTIGRHPVNQVVLADVRVSRRHALIQPQGEDEWWVVDFGSANGTWLNGQRIAHPTRLRAGDEIHIAGQRLVFRQSTSAAGGLDERTRSTVTVCEVRSFQSWLLLLDIIGSTRLVESTPAEELPVLVGHWFSACREAVEAGSGLIYQFLGDGLFAYWTERPGAEAHVRTTLSRLRELQQERRPPFRIVLHLGRVSSGSALGGGEQTLMGSDMHYTFRMEKLAGRLGEAVIVSAAAAQALGKALDLRSLGQHALQGFSGEFEFFGAAE